MAKVRLNGTARWIIVALAILTLAFNSGVTYNHIHNLTKAVDKLTTAFEKMDENIDNINIKLAERNNP